MGASLESLWSPKESKILLLGSSSAGKTSILYQLKLGKKLEELPPLALNTETVPWKKHTLAFFDLSSQDNIRPIWPFFFPNTKGLIYVIDSSDAKSFEIVKQNLSLLLTEKELSQVPLLVCANKEDLATNSESDISQSIGLNIIQDRAWRLQKTSALTGKGLADGVDWLCMQMDIQESKAREKE